MEKDESLQQKDRRRWITVRSGLKSGYRPVHGLVAPDGWTKWTPGWYDMDSMSSNAATSAPPPPE